MIDEAKATHNASDGSFIVELAPLPGMVQMVIAAYVPEKGWLTTRRAISGGMVTLDEPREAMRVMGEEAQMATRSVLGALKRAGVDIRGNKRP